MTGKEYADAVAKYVLHRFACKEVSVFREVSLGKSIIGKNRRLDIFVFEPRTNRAVAIECKYQGGVGTVDEKIPYALQDLAAMPMPAVLAYAGDGFSAGVVHLLAASELAAYCLPRMDQMDASEATRELDHQLAMRFGSFDLIAADNEQRRFG